MSSLVEILADRAIGVVKSVNATKIEMLIDSFAPQATALNTGTPLGFPRINGHLLIPRESGATVCIVTAVEIEKQPYPKRKEIPDTALVDLAFQLRLAKLTPIGTLTSAHCDKSGDPIFKLQRGVDVFPSVGDPVLLPTKAQLRAVVEGESSNSDRQIQIGICPTANGAPVYVNPDKLFGRHLAVLGNTGAGKSCTVAGLIRWSLEAARKVCAENTKHDKANARFIILDPNGEYAKAFKSFCPRVFRIPGFEEPESDLPQTLKIPAWLWNGEEWSAFTEAAPKAQQPILLDAIRELREEFAKSQSQDMPTMITEDTPVFFDVDQLSERIAKLAKKNFSGHNPTFNVDPLITRIDKMFAAGPFVSITKSDSKSPLDLKNWLKDYLDPHQDSNSEISIVDLSFVPSDAIHIVVTSLARIIFEAIQHYRRHTDSELPTVLVLDEAHTFIHRELKSENPNAKDICRRTFERIAREGRKFGFGLVLASQRPSDISSTVLSQCNTFLLHRIVNDRDQDRVKRFVSDGLGDLLQELPNLPSRRAILLGWGAPTPIFAEILELPENQRPHSRDPELWDVWTENTKRDVDWSPIVDEWISLTGFNESNESSDDPF